MEKTITCPACESQEGFLDIETIGEARIVRCARCDLDFSEPMLNPGGEWYNDAYIIRHSAIDSRIRDYYKWAVNTLPVRGKLLDIGCGEGVFVNYAIENGFEAYGIDFSREAIELGKSYFGLETIYNGEYSDIEKLTGFSKFDALTFFEVLEHIMEPSEFVEKAKSLLKEKGCVAVSVPYRDRWPLREFNDYPPHHLTRWTEKALRIFFERNGFRDIQIKKGSRFRSYWIFIGYFIRIIIYRTFGMYEKGLYSKKSSHSGGRFFSHPITKKLFSIIRPRVIRDILILPFVMLTYPFVFKWFKGYNLMMVATKAD